MKWTVSLLLVGVLFVSGLAFAQGMRVEKKKVAEPKKVESTVKVEQDVEIVLELEEAACGECKKSEKGPCEKCAAKKAVKRRMIIVRGEDDRVIEVNGDLFTFEGEDGKGGRGGAAGGRVVVLEGDDDLEKVIEDLKKLRARIKAAKSPEELEKLAQDLKKASVRVQAGRHAAGARHHSGVRTVDGDNVIRWLAGTHGKPAAAHCACGGCNAPRPAPKPAPRCQNCAPRPPACSHCAPRPAQPGPMGPMGPMMMNGLRQSLDALRGEISGLRHEMRAMRAAHAAKAPGAFHINGTMHGAHGVAVKKAPPKPPAPPVRGMIVGKKGGAAGGAFVARKPVTPDPRQAKLEKEVQDLRRETAHLKAMMAELLRKMDEMQKSNEK